MKNLLKLMSLLMCTMLFSLLCYAENLTDKSVKSLISQVDKAIINMNANQVAAVFSDNVTIKMTITTNGQQSVMTPSKEEYLEMLKEGWSQYNNYKYSRSNMKISMIGNKAVVTANVHEKMTVHGQSISGTSKEKVTIELINGKPLITDIISYTSM